MKYRGVQYRIYLSIEGSKQTSGTYRTLYSFEVVMSHTAVGAWIFSGLFWGLSRTTLIWNSKVLALVDVGTMDRSSLKRSAQVVLVGAIGRYS